MLNLRRVLVPRKVGRLISNPVNLPSVRSIVTPKVRKPRRKR